MGSSLKKMMCYVLCGRRREREAEEECEEVSETKPILQDPGEPLLVTDTQRPTPALKVPRPRSKDVQSLGQAHRLSADALTEENAETCSAADPTGRAEGWEAAWNPMDFFVAPADEEIEVEAAGLTQAGGRQEEVGHPEIKREAVPCVAVAQPVGDTARGAELVAGGEQPREQAEPGSEGALCAGITLLERNILNLVDIGSETAPGQGCEMEPPAETGEVSIGREFSLCAGQVAEETEPYLPVEGMDTAPLVQISPQSARAELTCLLEEQALPALTVQNPSEATASGVVGLYSPCPMSWELLCSEWGFLEPANPPFGSLKQESQRDVPSAQGMESLPCAEPAGLGELLQPSQGVLCELEGEGSREGDAGEAELQHRTVQQTVLLPGEPETCVPVPVKQETEFSDVPLLLP